jgi:hypothetical protein
MDAVRAGVVGDREGARTQLTVTGVEVGVPRAPSEQAATFSVFERVEVKPDWLRMAIVGQARAYAFRWFVPCGQSRDCDVTRSGLFTPTSGPFHTVVANKHGAPVDALYMGKNNYEIVTVGALLEGDLAWSGPMVKVVDSKGRPKDQWNSTFDRPLVLTGLFATASPPLLGGLLRFGLEVGGEYTGDRLRLDRGL